VGLDAEHLPSWLSWQTRPFPDANLLLVHGRQPALVDSGFVGHAEQTAGWVRARTGRLDLVVNTHWHSDHVGANALLQAGGAGIAASAPDALALARRDPGCCQAEYFDQPVAPYTVDEPLDDGQLLRLGDTDWQVVRTPGHTPGHLALWQPEERLLAVGDALSDYDVGMVNLTLDGPEAAMMIRGGIPVATVEPYLHARAWLRDAARLLNRSTENFAAELIESMLRGRSVVVREARLHAALEHAPVEPAALRVPMPRAWPAAQPVPAEPAQLP